MAKYTRKKVDLDEEMNIAIGVIVSTKFCRDFSLLIEDDLDLLKSRYLRIIVSWALKYYSTYDHCCNASIMDVFLVEKKNIPTEEDITLIESALETINEKFIDDDSRFDSDYIYKQVEDYIKGRALEDNSDKVKGLVSQGKIAEAERIHKDFKRKEKNGTKGVNVFKDMEELSDLFSEDETLFTIPGALGELIPEIVPGDLVWVAGNAKTGKSFYSMQLAMYAVQQGLNVGYFTLEMNKKLFGKRIAQFVSGRTFKKIKSQKYTPYFDGNGNILYEKHKVKQLSKKRAEVAYKLFDKQCGGGSFHLLDTTTGGSSIDSIKNTIINKSQYENVDFDVIFIDQISLVSGANGKEVRHQLNDTAVRLKRELCEEMGLAVFSPLQFSKQAIKTGGDETTIGESYGLFHHATILINLNQTKEEKERGIMRISASGRSEEYMGEVVSLQNFTIGRPILDNAWKKDVPNYNDVICSGDFNEKEIQDLEDI